MRDSSSSIASLAIKKAKEELEQLEAQTKRIQAIIELAKYVEGEEVVSPKLEKKAIQNHPKKGSFYRQTIIEVINKNGGIATVDMFMDELIKAGANIAKQTLYALLSKMKSDGVIDRADKIGTFRLVD